MAVNREHFKERYDKGGLPAWLCPECNAASLQPVEGSFQEHETAESTRSREVDAWEPDWYVGRFVYLLRCARSDCRETVCISGDVHQSVEHDRDNHMYVSQVLLPRSVYPATPAFVIPPECPDDVRAELSHAFGLLWHDPNAAVGRIRTSLEYLLTSQGVPRFPRKGKRKRLALHKRIELLKARNETAAELIMALKWMGNDATHESSLTRGQVLDGLDLVEHLMAELVCGRSAKLKAFAARVNKRCRSVPSRLNAR